MLLRPEATDQSDWMSFATTPEVAALAGKVQDGMLA